jgi:hypothetical protein
MSETQFADTVAGWLAPYVAGCEVATIEHGIKI